MLTKEEIRLRDPFILPKYETKTYFLYGTTDENVWDGKGTGFDVYKSKDLLNWEGPFPAFRPDEGFWADHHFWAPEVHLYNGRYYMFASFKAVDKCRGTQILVSDNPLGPFTPLTDEPVTPRDWECLDGTLFLDDQQDPWMIFCHEWLQVEDGEICAIRLTKDLRKAAGEPVLLFKASDAGWTVPAHERNYVTDGPFLFRNSQGELQMLWSSRGQEGYAIGVAHSTSGNILGPWVHDKRALFDKDGGHGMLFYTFSNQLMLTIHAPNKTPNERPVFFNLDEVDGKLIIK
ncbi:glycoside hydrolase [Bacillus sp. SA1-12]|uniref:glycoside hydrolase family 43 protein n=1 Tax=Bacillus sp. SA1-12 TaxID=1455638 RepID=UPI0006255C64|nr:glycoside hydrolase family 43 protein [Bacillus sp. SA1-12]KKI93475.1 glycoside hydrolase [Bacillus sp. SA1-12]